MGDFHGNRLILLRVFYHDHKASQTLAAANEYRGCKPGEKDKTALLVHCARRGLYAVKLFRTAASSSRT